MTTDDTVTATLAQWAALTEAATEGPWDTDGGGTSIGHGDKWVAHVVDQQEPSEPVQARADAEFIAAARTAMPALLGFVREVRKIHVRKRAVFSWQSGLRYEDPCSTCDGKAGVHACGCWADSDTEYVCEGCEQAGPKRQPAPWPCPTEQAAQKWIGEADDDR